jgi:REP element-mobilizing transposase RayT
MSYTHLLYHLVFATKDRLPLIAEPWEHELYRYLGGIIKNLGGEAIEINGMPEHVHVLARLKPLPALPDFMREIKASSSRWAKQYEPSFTWQRRYGAFTVSESMCGSVRNYIRNQKVHHEMQTFEGEFTDLLRLHNVEFEEPYLWS